MSAESRHLVRNLILMIVAILIILLGYSRAERYDENNQEYEEARISTVINNANFCLAEHILNPSMMTASDVFVYYSEEAINSIDKKCCYLDDRVVSIMGDDALKEKREKQQKIVFNFESDVQITNQVVAYKWFQPERATAWTTEQWKHEKTFHKYSLRFGDDGWKITSDEWQKAPFASPKPEAKGWMLR